MIITKQNSAGFLRPGGHAREIWPPLRDWDHFPINTQRFGVGPSLPVAPGAWVARARVPVQPRNILALLLRWRGRLLEHLGIDRRIQHETCVLRGTRVLAALLIGAMEWKVQPLHGTPVRERGFTVGGAARSQ